jgi:hypothetical protein
MKIALSMTHKQRTYMKARLYCSHCEKHYEVEVDNVRLMQKFNNENIVFKHNTYYYASGCFFKDVVILKRRIAEND